MDEMIEKKLKPESVAVDERGIAANQIISELAAVKETKELIQNYDVLTNSIIEVAYEVPPKDARGAIQLSSKLNYVKIKGLNTIPVLTDTIPVRPDSNYTSYAGIYRFEPSYKLVGGINAPKRTECIGTDGVKRAQLIKGMSNDFRKDDLRQDAVMQQVFELTNQLFTESKDTQEHRITKDENLQDYSPIPEIWNYAMVQQHFTPSFYTNRKLICLGDDKKSGVHFRYYPSSHSYGDIYTYYTKNNKDPERMFAKLCKEFPPAFKFFFLEKFLSPLEHYMAKARYAKSVAVSSMVGYILGLGDRHLSNILVDLKTAEFVHIDFGIAFDKGKILPTPELVPFRLTRDVIDGFGPLGIEGGFRLNCERSMSVLRENKEKLLTVLEVMLHDPLYDWSVGPSKVAARQAGEWEQLKQQEAGQGNRMAIRALMMLKEKLDGRKHGSSLSVAGQVGDLIQEAMDPAHLARIFVGWAPWC